MVDILEVLELLNSRSLLGILNSPEELRSAIIALEFTLKFLRDNEQQLYPEQAPKSGRSRRNDGVIDINDPAWQRDKILKVFQRTCQPLTSAQLHGQYIKNVHAGLLEMRCEELVELGELVPVNSKRGYSRKYSLPSDVALQLERVAAQTKTPMPVARLTLDGREVGVYLVVAQPTAGIDAYVVNRVKHLARWGESPDFIPAEDRDLVFLEGSKGFDVVHKWVLSIGHDNRYYDFCSEPLIQDGDRWLP